MRISEHPILDDLPARKKVYIILYELVPIPQKGMVVEGCDRKGETVC
jgi:hypothetical protein